MACNLINIFFKSLVNIPLPEFITMFTHSHVKRIYWLFPSFGNFATLSKIISVDYIYLCCAVLSCSVVSTVFDPMECSPPDYSVHGASPGRNTGVGCHALLQGIFPTQGSNPRLLHYRQFVYRLSHQEALTIFIWAYIFILGCLFCSIDLVVLITGKAFFFFFFLLTHALCLAGSPSRD